jgi:hypothetical protein
MAAEASPTDNPIVIPKETLRHDSQGDYVFARSVAPLKVGDRVAATM